MAQRAPQPFAKVFADELDDIERRALQAGTNLTAICKEIGISRSTPDRWRRRSPKTIRLVDKMKACVVEAEKRRGINYPSAG